jgi:ubiquinone/menaquinone biosynthesis C-methylase UbiE
MPIPRVLETEVMDTPDEAADYDSMDHSEVNRRFVDDLLAVVSSEISSGEILDLGTGTALIPIELAGRGGTLKIRAVDLAQRMLELAARHIERLQLQRTITLELIDAKTLPFDNGRFRVVMSNSIIHHIPTPAHALAEAVRVTDFGGWFFFRDLMRPNDHATLRCLVDQYAAGANDHQRQMFADSLHAALTLDEMRALVVDLGFAADTVVASSDRHWTWAAQRLR